MTARKPKAKPPEPATAVAPSKPLTDGQQAELVAFRERAQRSSRPPRFEADESGKTVCAAKGVDRDLFAARLGTAVGSTDHYATGLLANQIANSVDGGDVAMKTNMAIALVAGIGPRNETEGMLAAQMVGCHSLAMSMVYRANKADRVAFMATYGNLVAKLMNVYTRQLEALARLRGQTGQQTVRVEHVTVEAGGQAVVGAVTTGAGDASKHR